MLSISIGWFEVTDINLVGSGKCDLGCWLKNHILSNMLENNINIDF